MTTWMLQHRERLVALVAASSWAAPLTAFAQLNNEVVGTPGAVQRSGFDTFEKTIKQAFNIVIMIAGVVFVVLLLLGGIMYLTAAGNEDSTKKARQLMLDAIVGLVIVVTAWAVGTYVLSLLGIGRQGELDISPVKN